MGNANLVIIFGGQINDFLVAGGADAVAPQDGPAVLLGDVPQHDLGDEEMTGRAFRAALGVDPFGYELARLRASAIEAGADPATAARLGRDECLDLLLGLAVAPGLGRGLSFVHDFPASQAALARLRTDPPQVAERFELYVDGIEIANGYHELRDAGELHRRMQRDLETRSAAGRRVPEVDERLLAAHEAGLPACAGVAVGLDRLVMLAGRYRSLQEVLAFAQDTA